MAVLTRDTPRFQPRASERNGQARLGLQAVWTGTASLERANSVGTPHLDQNDTHPWEKAPSSHFSLKTEFQKKKNKQTEFQPLR